MPVTPGSGVGISGSSTTVVDEPPPITPVGIRPFHRKPDPVVIRIFTVRVVVVPARVVVVTISSSASSAEVVTTIGVTLCGEPSEPLLLMFSRPMLAITFSEGVMGNNINITRIIPVSRTNPIHDAIVILVDLFRFDMNPDLLLI